MKKKLQNSILISAAIAFFILPWFSLEAAAPDELKKSIEDKTKELESVKQAIRENERVLLDVQTQGKTLNKEISSLDDDIKHINLGINASLLSIDKLNLEIDSLGYVIDDSEEKIEKEKQGIIKILRELQEREQEGILAVFLKHKNLSDSFSDLQNLVDLSAGLKAAIVELSGAKNELEGQLQEKFSKKDAVELETANLKNKKIIVAQSKQDKEKILQDTKNKEQSYQKIVNELKNKQTAIAQEVEKLDAELRQQIDPSALPAKVSGILGMPVNGATTQDYGATSFARYGYQGKWHNGVDIAAPLGTPVFAAESGRIVAVGDQDKYCFRGAYGKFIVIQHDNNLTTLYAHLSLQVAQVDSIVSRGQLIGYIGRTGYATGPHLHFTVFASPTFRMGPSRTCGPMPYGGDINPLNYL